jgi:hypothetical protein
MISIYTTFRSIENYGFIQEQSFLSWLALDPRPEIIVLGDGKGIAELCKQKGFVHIPALKCARSGAPYINAFIALAEEKASYDHMLLCSSDIIIKQDTYKVLEAAKNHTKQFCVCARKQNVKIKSANLIRRNWAIWQAGDYFLHTKGVFANIPPFIIGRCALDNWMYRNTINQGIMIDASYAATVWHQMHGHTLDVTSKIRHLEVEYNRNLYKRHPVTMPQWEQMEWYSEFCTTDIRFANYRMLEDFTIVKNDDPFSRDDR